MTGVQTCALPIYKSKAALDLKTSAHALVFLLSVRFSQMPTGVIGGLAGLIAAFKINWIDAQPDLVASRATSSCCL